LGIALDKKIEVFHKSFSGLPLDKPALPSSEKPVLVAKPSEVKPSTPFKKALPSQETKKTPSQGGDPKPGLDPYS
jgi:hypothetical protein